ncbi:hypothetical protein TrST_g1650 [Triparma strigata]|uniref:HMA domain-containing protein n=1 Tax=Triparma strigata TaxID=1606541 RepID=A0A9W7AIE6_9STRA|nr:hypothetical protein TrST_g1650 [Triparma strigata]
MFNFLNGSSEPAETKKSTSNVETEMVFLKVEQECASCKRMNCPCGEHCQCGPFCRCVASDLIAGIDEVTVAKSYSTPHTSYALAVGGMTCVNCSSGVERALKKLGEKFDGAVKEISVNLVMHSARVIVEDDKGVDGDVLVDTVETAGYDCKVNSSSAVDKAVGEDGKVSAELAKCRFTIEEYNDDNEIDDVVFESIKSLDWAQNLKEVDNALAKEFEVEYDKTLYNVGVRSLTNHVQNHLASTKKFSSAVVKASPPAPPSSSDQSKIEMLKKRRKFLFSLIGTLPVFLTTMVLSKIGPTHDFLMTKIVDGLPIESVILFVFATPVQFVSGWQFYIGTYHSLKTGLYGMDVLICLGTTASYFYACLMVILAASSGKMNMGSHFFETSAVLISFVLLGKYLQAVATRSTSKAIDKLCELTPGSATVCVGKDGNDLKSWPEDLKEVVEIQVPSFCVQRGDFLKVIRGAGAPCDGKVVDGTCSMDESMVTGESMPCLKIKDGDVIGGTVCVEGTCYVIAENVGDDTALSQIVQLMVRAQAVKAPIQQFADNISAVFVPVVLACSLLTFVVWLALTYSGAVPKEWYEDEGELMFSFMFAIATLVIACPCALGLAAPTAVMVGTGVGAKNGVLIKGGDCLEKLAKVTAVVFDKTGTLTMGRPEVATFLDLADMGEEILYLIGCAEKSSEHPLAVAVVKYCEEKLEGKRDLFSPPDFKAMTGKGISCVVDGKDVAIGNRSFLAMRGLVIDEDGDVEKSLVEMENEGQTAILVSVNQKISAIVGIADQLKPDSAETIKRLQMMGIEAWMVTGDNLRTAKAIARKVGLSDENIIAEALPAGKVLKIESLQSEGKVVAMVGDGINDSPALVQADAGVAIGAGTEIAIEAADMVLVRNAISDVIVAIDISKAIFSRIKLNFVWALGYNSCGIPIAMGLFYPIWKVGLPPSIAALAMALSSISVVLSSLHLKWWKPKFRVDIQYVQ